MPKPMTNAEATRIFFTTLPFSSMSREGRRLGSSIRTVETNATTNDASGGGASGDASPNDGGASPNGDDASDRDTNAPAPA